MTIAGTHPEQGLRVALDLDAVDQTHARYRGHAYTPHARYALELAVEIETGSATLHVGAIEPREGHAPPSMSDPPPSLPSADLAFVRQVGKQLWRLSTQTPAEQGGGRWSHRVQRWRARK